ncbi:MAG: DUF4465 domain-containing protein [Bacteroidota bacterium]
MRLKTTLLFIWSFAFILTTLNGQTISTFENLALSPNSYWNGASQSLGTMFEDGNAAFVNNYDTAYGGFWSSGFAYSNVIDTVTAGMGNMYASMAGVGYNGSSIYAVGQVDAYRQINPKIVLKPAARGKIVAGAYFTNATYSAINMRDGDAYGKKFGGVTGNDPDWFKITIKKWLNGSLAVDSVEFYLADFRSSNNSEDYIVKDWQWADLSSLGNVDSLTFILSSSDVGAYGINTPLFFCIDNFTTVDQGVTITENESIGINIYPNPTSENLNIEMKENTVKNIEIIDLAGRTVYKTNVSNSNSKINISDLSSGMYYIRIQGNNYNINRTFIKR